MLPRCCCPLLVLLLLQLPLPPAPRLRLLQATLRFRLGVEGAVPAGPAFRWARDLKFDTKTASVKAVGCLTVEFVKLVNNVAYI